MPRKYSAEFKDKAARQATWMMRLEDLTQGQACTQVTALLGISSDTLRNWVRDHPDHPGRTTTAKRTGGQTPEEELARLRKENKELERANAILKSASAFFAAEPGRPTMR